jgi:predicted amidohydrolase
MTDLRYESIGDVGSLSAFSVSLAHPSRTCHEAVKLLREAIARGADIVVFPELCMTTEGQSRLQEALRKLTTRRPFLVLGGTALTPEGRNEAVVLDGRGNVLFRQHKLFPYVMSASETERYGIEGDLYLTARRERITTTPRVLRILDTPLGRIGVLICEDLSVSRVFGPIAESLALDLLLVPVMDGAQRDERWTADRALYYARECSTAVVVATTRALVRRHIASERKRRGGEPFRAADEIGLYVPGGHACKVSPVLCGARSGFSIFEIKPPE